MHYRIGQLAEALGCSVDTLRYYESEKLLQATGRSHNGYRFYNDAARQQLNFILRAKAVGFSLQEIRELLAIRLDPQAAACGDVKQIADSKLRIVDHKIAELQAIRKALQTISDSCHGGPVPANHCSILQSLESGKA